MFIDTKFSFASLQVNPGSLFNYLLLFIIIIIIIIIIYLSYSSSELHQLPKKI